MPFDVRIMSLEKYLISAVGEIIDDSISVKKIDSILIISTDKGAISVKECEANEWEIQYFSLDPNLKINCEVSKDLNHSYLEASKGNYISASYFKKLLPYEKALEVSLDLLATILPIQNTWNKNLN